MKLIRNITKHPKASFRLTALTLVTAFTIPTLIFGWNPFAVIGIDLLIIAVTYLAIMMIIAAPIVSKERKFNDECTPQPLIEELRFQITTPKNSLSRFNIIIDLSSALFENGECDEAFSVLRKLCDSSDELNSEQRFVLYSKILSFYAILKKTADEARETYDLALGAFNSIEEKKRSNEIRHTYSLLNLDWMLLCGQYNECIASAEQITARNMRESIYLKTVVAYSASRSEHTDLAKSCCEFVIESAPNHYYSKITTEILERL